METDEWKDDFIESYVKIGSTKAAKKAAKKAVKKEPPRPRRRTS